MADVSLYERPGSHPNALSLARPIYERSPRPQFATLSSTNPRTLSDLPFDVLLMIAEHLEPESIATLQSICHSLREFAISRPIWLHHATKLLDLCKPLPIVAFERVWELDARTLARLVRRAHHIQDAWMYEHPRLRPPMRVLVAPRREDVVWLSPITSRYTLSCTKSGNVLCWDVARGECVACWESGKDWEIWKCRVEFEERTVYFAMAKKVASGHGTDCQLMALSFPEENDAKPEYKKICCFYFPGHVISVYLLNPVRRLLSAYIWIPSTSSLGLYVLLDWTIPLYVYINTGIPCEPLREWSCIGYDPENIVIHAEEEKGGFQYFYPYNFLKSFATPISPTNDTPKLVPAPKTIEYPFIKNEYPFENYQIQSSHFVRQWWPTLPHMHNIRRRSCTIVLLTMRVPDDAPIGPDSPPPGSHLFTIGQHYFSIPLQKSQLRWWYVREPFEIVCVPHIALGEHVQDMDGHVDELEPDLEPEPQMQPPTGPEPGDYENGGALSNLLHAADGLVNNFTNLIYGVNANDEEEEEEDAEGESDNDEETIGDANAGEEAVDPNAEIVEVSFEVLQDPEHDHQHDTHVHVHINEPDEIIEESHIIPLIAVDFGCAVWLEYVAFGSDEKRLRFITFPPVDVDRGAEDFDCLSAPGAVRTLEVPSNIDLGEVRHVGIDQAQGSVILGLLSNKVFIMRYE